MPRAANTKAMLPLGKWPAHSDLTVDLCGIEPRPKGSKRAFAMQDKTTQKWRAIIVDENDQALKTFERELREAALAAITWRGLPCALQQPFEIELATYQARPAGHFGAKGNLLDSAPLDPIVKPDLDKLERAVLDALTGVVYDDDSRVVRVNKQKRYAGPMHDVGVWLCAKVRPSTRKELTEWAQIRMAS